MDLEVEANLYNGEYGTHKDVGSIIHIKIRGQTNGNSSDDNSNNNSNQTSSQKNKNKEIIFLIDISGSMESSMKDVKSSLLAFRDTIVGKTPTEMEVLDSVNRDGLLRNFINIRLITFSNTAKELWSNKSEQTYEDAVLSLRSEAMTNMSDALEMAFEKCNPDGFTWIIAMTDGESNEGSCRTASSFHQLVNSKKPLNSKIVSLGYGDRFDPEVLYKIGTFAYMEDSEMIPVVLGNLANEIMTSIGFNCVIDVIDDESAEQFTDDTIIIPAGEDQNVGKVIVGKRVMGTICENKTYDYIYLTKSTNPLMRAKIRITYFSAEDENNENNEINETYNIKNKNTVPEDYHRDLYFNQEKKRLIYRLYKALQKYNRRMIKTEIERIEFVLQDWNDEVSSKHRDEVEKMLENIKRDRNSVRQTHSSLNYAVGSGYTLYSGNNSGDSSNNNDINNDSNNNYLNLTLSATHHYLQSPLINNS